MCSVNDQLRAAYDAIPYQAGAFRYTHPENLRTVAALVGLHETANAEHCRVLEIGCGAGGNLLPMAAALTGSDFLGIDLSPKQIEMGDRLAREAGLHRVTLRCQDLLDFDKSEGAFDYIIAHGLYSWVPADVRDQLIRLIARHLTPAGLAYISYNTLPGWHMRAALAEMMRYHAGRTPNAADALARAKEMLALAKLPAVAPAGYKQAMSETVAMLSQHGDWYLAHEFLAPVNEPVYFRQFVDHAAAHGLRHLAAAGPVFEAFNWLTPAIQQQVQRIAGGDELEREQYLDFLHGRAFRASILCHEGATVAGPIGAKALHGMHVSAQLIETRSDSTSGTGDVFRFGSKYTDKRIPARETWQLNLFRRLQTAWPRSVPFDELTDDIAPTSRRVDGGFADTVAQHVFVAYKAEVIELSTRPIDFIATAAPTQPRVTALARLQAAGGQSVVNLRHENIGVSVAMQQLLPLLDGTRNQQQLGATLRELIARGEVTVNASSGVPTDGGPLLTYLLQAFAGDSLLLA